MNTLPQYSRKSLIFVETGEPCELTNRLGTPKHWVWGLRFSFFRGSGPLVGSTWV